MTPGFFRKLPPFAGAVAAVHQMERAGFQVWFCTSPILGHPTCCQEKLEWIQEHFGDAYVQRVVLCQDKTTVRGDILIDDKPNITGLHPPTWRQCLFDAPYNQCRSDLPRITQWSAWENPMKQLLVHSGMKRVGTSLASFSTIDSTDSNSDEDEQGPTPLKRYAEGLRDFSEELKAMGVYMA